MSNFQKKKKYRDANSGMYVLLCTRKLKISPEKKTKKNGDTSAVAKLKDARQLGCVFRDIEPPKSSPVSRKSTKVMRPNRRVQFSIATLRHANIRKSQGPSLGVIQFKNPHQRNSNAPKFEDRSQAETESQKQCACGDSSTESEIISLDASLRMDGVSALDLWDLVIEVFHSSSNQVQGHQERAR